MSKSIVGRKVRLFRCQIPPMIGPKILNAHVPKDLGWEAEIPKEGTGVLITMASGTQHFIPFANIQTTELLPEEQAEVLPLKSKAKAT